jgi:hypothetical protein
MLFIPQAGNAFVNGKKNRVIHPNVSLHEHKTTVRLILSGDLLPNWSCHDAGVKNEQNNRNNLC